MTYHENLRILFITGLTDTGREAAVHYFTERGYPKVYGESIVQQINDLAAAGQHHIVLDASLSATELQAIRHEFPGELLTISVDEFDQLNKAAVEAGFIDG